MSGCSAGCETSTFGRRSIYTGSNPEISQRPPTLSSVTRTLDAVTLLFVNQTATVDKSPPTDTTSSVRVTLDKVGGRWLISGFDPV